MKYLVTSGEMKKYDTYTIEEIGIAGEVLMERAALFSADLILDYSQKQKIEPKNLKVLLVCGQGNNGGDGLAVARILLDKMCKVTVCLIGNQEKASPEVKKQLHILKNYGVVPSSLFPQGEYDVIVDALFGIGLSREVTGEYAEVIDKMNEAKAWKLSLDVPSGIDATSGKVWGKAVKAHMTATFAYGKRGLYFYPGAEYAGEVKVGEIGITDRSFNGAKPEMYCYDAPMPAILPKRNPAGNKGTFGKVLAVAGSEGMPGAAILCSRAAFRAGAGMVKVVTDTKNQMVLQKTVPEAMSLCYESGEQARKPGAWWTEFEHAIEWADCLLAGPGLGNSTVAILLLKHIILQSAKPLVLDADALNLLAKNRELQQLLAESICEKNRTVVMTPHVGELARLCDCSIAEIKADFVTAARTAAAKYNCIMVCKDARTLVCEKEGTVYLNITGNSGMATAGSGDVLAGILAALYAADGAVDKGMYPATLGVYLHGKAGDYAAAQNGETAVMASDIIEALPMVQKGN